MFQIMSITDGGSFKCYRHETLFETTEPRAWEAHMHDGKHTSSGSGPCAICSTPTNYDHLAVGKKPVCAKCKKDLV